MAISLTQEEAETLIKTIKRFIGDKTFSFPTGKEKLVFDVIGERRGEEFVINIERKGIDHNKGTYQSRIKSNNIILLRLDINPTSIHINPDKTKICGTHLHIYSEKYEYREAIPFDIGNDDLYDARHKFFEVFHIEKPPRIVYEQTLFS